MDFQGAQKMNNTPAPGYRERADGVQSHVGHYGYGWSSTSNGINGMFLDIYIAGFNPSGISARAYGRQLRCLSE